MPVVLSVAVKSTSPLLASLYLGIASWVSWPLGMMCRRSLLTHAIEMNVTFAPESNVILIGLPSKEASRTKCGKGEIMDRNGSGYFSAFIFDWSVMGAEAWTPPRLAEGPSASQEEEAGTSAQAPWSWFCPSLPSSSSSPSSKSTNASSLRRQ